MQLKRPGWTTVTERRQTRGDPEAIDDILVTHPGVRHRVKQIVDRLRPQGVSRQRRLEDGDELDIGAAVDAIVQGDARRYEGAWRDATRTYYRLTGEDYIPSGPAGRSLIGTGSK